MMVRAMPITGHLKDRSGNVIAGSKVSVKMVTPITNVHVDDIIINNNGFFSTRPLPNGVYNFYHSGVFVTSIYHYHNSSIPCYRPKDEYLDFAILKNFSTYASTFRVSEYKIFLQVEGDYPTHSVMNLDAFYGIKIPEDGDTEPISVKGDLNYASVFLNMDEDSRFTTTRFNIEYNIEKDFGDKRVRNILWTGVPGVKYSEDHPVIIPIDYFSLITRIPYFSGNTGVSNNDILWKPYAGAHYLTIPKNSIDNEELHTELFEKTPLGSVIKIISIGNVGEGEPIIPPEIESPIISRAWHRPWYGILSKRLSDSVQIEPLRSNRYMTGEIINDPQNELVLNNDKQPVQNAGKINEGDTVYFQFFDGMQRAMVNMNEDINMRFTVTECPLSDIMLQNGGEMYSYEHSQDVIASEMGV